MAAQIVVDFDTIQVVVDKMAAIEREIDDVTSELFHIKLAASDGWSGEAKEIFSENCHRLRQKGVEVTYNLRTNRQNLQSAAGVFDSTEAKNKKVEQNLSADNIFV